ncbi:DMT family transporter [uncultured Clostridium sp.]|uniref:DMT family transporter n=1 Tax=uncultured Clostridium sp. TaxID=59620 RepID=UPI00261A456E|nr:DMT family transporter [uncultured Clostridium sp.]
MNNKKGISKGVFSALTWGLDTVISGIILSMEPFAGHVSLLFAPLVAVFLHDFLGAIWLLIYLTIKGEIVEFFKVFKKKEALYAAAAGVLGGPIGMGGYYLAIKNIGPSYSAAISSIYPIMGAILAAILLKEKLNKKGWMGLIIGVLGVVLLSMDGSGGSISIKGLLFALLPVIGWGSESIISSIGMKEGELKPVQTLNIRLLASGGTFAAIILPLIHGYGLVENLFTVNIPTLLLIVLVALIGAISLSSYYSAINDIGAVKAMVINITYVIWAVVFGLFMGTATITVSKILFIGLIFVGSAFVIASKKSEESLPVIDEYIEIKRANHVETAYIRTAQRVEKLKHKEELVIQKSTMKIKGKEELEKEKNIKKINKKLKDLAFEK